MKRTVMGLMAIVVAVASYAFVTNGNSEKHRDTHWYQFVGDPTKLSDVQDETLYEYVSSPVGCSGNTLICAIDVPGDNSPSANPDPFTQSILDDLEDAFDGVSKASFIQMISLVQ